jgi:hypothetical protein
MLQNAVLASAIKYRLPFLTRFMLIIFAMLSTFTMGGLMRILLRAWFKAGLGGKHGAGLDLISEKAKSVTYRSVLMS